MSSEFVFEPVGYINGIVKYYVPSIFSKVEEHEDVDIFETASEITLQVDVHYFSSPNEEVTDPRDILNSALEESVEKSKAVLLTTGFAFASYLDDPEDGGVPNEAVQLCCPYSPGKLVVLRYTLIKSENTSDIDAGLAFHAVRQLSRWTRLHEEK